MAPSWVPSRCVLDNTRLACVSMPQFKCLSGDRPLVASVQQRGARNQTRLCFARLQQWLLRPPPSPPGSLPAFSTFAVSALFFLLLQRRDLSLSTPFLLAFPLPDDPDSLAARG